MGGRLRFFKSEWYKITSDPNILDMVSGMHIDLKSLPSQHSYAQPLRLSPQEIHAADEQVKKLLDKQAIKHSYRGQPGEFVSLVFLRPKKDGVFRMILNLKKFNKNVSYNHFKMETLQHILTLVMPECFMAIFDLQDAYLVTPIAGEHIRFLKFTWRGKVYVYVVLPFGLSEAPRKFTTHPF